MRCEEDRILLRVWLRDLPEGEEDADAEYDIVCEATASVERVGENRFRLLEPCSITPFGSVGPMFDLGTILELWPTADGAWRYVRSVETPPVWSFGFEGVASDPSHEPRLHAALEALIGIGGMWEWSVGVLVVQVPRKAEEGECPAEIRAPVERLARVLRSWRVRRKLHESADDNTMM